MRFLIIGLGSIGSRHTKNLAALGHEVIGCDIGDKLPTSDIDGCIIATPTVEHANNIHWAVEHGIKHVLVEKPIADRVTERLVADLQYAKEVGVHIIIGNNLRFHPSVRLARRYINDGLIGNPIWAHICCAQFNDKYDYLRDGVTLNWGGHEIDEALWLLGPATMSAATAVRNDISDIILQHKQGCQSVIHLDYLTKPEMRQAVIIGDKGRLVVNLVSRYVALQRGDTGQPPEQQDGSFDEDYKTEIAAFVNSCQPYTKPWPGAFAQDGIDTLNIIDAARKMAAYDRICPA